MADDTEDMNPEEMVDADLASLIDRPGEWYVDDDEIIIVNGVQFPAEEFTETERIEWLRLREKHKLAETEVEYRHLIEQLQENEHKNLLDTYQKRLDVVNEERNKIVENTKPLDWSPELEQYVEQLAEKADEIEEKIEELQKPLSEALYGRVDELQQIVIRLKESRDPAFLEMAWKMATRRGQTTVDLNEWISQARGGDRLSAQQLVAKGNFMWEAVGLNRQQKRALKDRNKKIRRKLKAQVN